MAGTSFRQGGSSLAHLAGLDVPAKQVERVVRRIGLERCAQRDAEVEAFGQLPLVEKSKPPAGVTPPDLAVVMADGGRLQVLDRSDRRANDPAKAGHGPSAQPPKGEAQPDPVSQPGGSPQAPEGSGGEAVVPPASACPPDALDSDEEGDRPVSEPGSRSQFWREDKVGLLLHRSSPQGKQDPSPDIPKHFIDPRRIKKLIRELKAKARAAPAAEADTPDEQGAGQPEGAKDDEAGWDPPKLLARQVVATRRTWKCFGPMLAAAAWSLGFFASARRAYLGDGSSHVWGVWRRHFSTFEPILDFIHALSYVYAAALAGRSFGEGWAVYMRWIGWVWRGEVGRVLEELRARQQEVGLPAKGDKEGSPAVVVKEALGFLENHQGQMRYNEYRRDGLPITTSHVESEIKRINHRVKGTEKFWSEQGAECILQLRADYLSDDKPREAFWQKRQAEQTGQRPYRRRR
jgi:hypothetical protein